MVLDDATSEIYYAQMVEEESTPTVMAALRQVVEREGVFCALYSDRGSHFWLTPKAGGKVDRQRLTQVGRALRELGIQMIPAYSPEARGRSERSFPPGRGGCNKSSGCAASPPSRRPTAFSTGTYIAEFNRRFQVPAEQPGTAFLPLGAQDLDRIFSLHHERVVNRDNTVQFETAACRSSRSAGAAPCPGARSPSTSISTAP